MKPVDGDSDSKTYDGSSMAQPFSSEVVAEFFNDCHRAADGAARLAWVKMQRILPLLPEITPAELRERLNSILDLRLFLMAEPPISLVLMLIDEILVRIEPTRGEPVLSASGSDLRLDILKLDVISRRTRRIRKAYSRAAKNAGIESRKKSRQAFLVPLLKKNNLTRYKWSEVARVDLHTVLNYYEGRTKKLERKIREVLAKTLKISTDELPE